ncbi:MAG TPA: Gfo/Idh/MocA family oxidoreductase, partial [Thermodesulfobacteriota bacterium]|nr:Gfo/Idh/MocA family oxidoreductase [Thermodesulfobacteriota bacterium]
MGKKKEIQIAIVGLGKIGSTFLKKLLEKERQGITLMGVVEQNKDTPGIELAKDKGIKIYDSLDKLLYLSQEVDVIFDL